MQNFFFFFLTFFSLPLLTYGLELIKEIYSFIFANYKELPPNDCMLNVDENK